MSRVIKRLSGIVFNKTLYGAIIVLILWFILHLVVHSQIIPSPYASLRNFIDIFPGTLLPHLFVSLLRISAAILFSLVFGTTIGLWIGVSRRADEFVTPIVYMLYPLPKIAFLPVLMVLFGLGNSPKIILIIIIIIFQIILAARDGVKEIPKELFYSAMTLGLNMYEMYKHLIFPAVLPKIITALRLSVGISISALFFAENFATTYGIGYFIMNSWLMVNYLEMFSGIVALAIMGYILFKLIDLMEYKLCAWIWIGKEKMNN